ncbi:MAG TPA: complex I subunit 1 family protein [Acidimicrobiales bacterium]|jgi:NADH-quinone oxidoreductase subunit H|nr:complex I subunit 1 family protein [Acidimicrobiales bacterium]
MGFDPLFAHGLNLAVWLILLVKVVIVFVIVLVSVLFMIMYERKVVALMGVRYGPNRAGPGGWLQSLADGTKLLFKEAFTPRTADRPVYKVAPYIMLVPVLTAFSIVPLGGTITIAHHTTELQLADPQWGILYLLMTSGLAVYGVILAGWASGSKYPLLGSVRASAQMVSYEAVLGLTTATVVLVSGSLSTSKLVAQQSGHLSFLHWNWLHTGIIPFILFSIAITAEMTRAPFDLVEAEEELSGGYNLEYSSVDFAWFYLAEYAALVTNSAVIVTLWLGGPNGPTVAGQGLGPVWFTVKTLVILYVFVWIRATLPRLRYDQLMDLGWKQMIPLSLALLMVVSGFRSKNNVGGSGFLHWFAQYKWGWFAIAASVLLGAFFLRAVDVGQEATEIEATRDARLHEGPL